LSRSTMLASCSARSRVISLSRTIPVSARPSASRPVLAAIQAPLLPTQGFGLRKRVGGEEHYLGIVGEPSSFESPLIF
jgi:hypothetical protein